MSSGKPYIPRDHLGRPNTSILEHARGEWQTREDAYEGWQEFYVKHASVKEISGGPFQKAWITLEFKSLPTKRNVYLHYGLPDKARAEETNRKLRKNLTALLECIGYDYKARGIPDTNLSFKIGITDLEGKAYFTLSERKSKGYYGRYGLELQPDWDKTKELLAEREKNKNDSWER